MFKLLQNIVYQVTGRTDLPLDTDFIQDLELNSFDIMNIICAFEDRFGTTIPNRDVWHLHKVRDVLDYMGRHGFIS